MERRNNHKDVAMTLSVSHLEANTPLTKTFALGPNGTLQKHSYPHAKNFTSHTERVRNIEQLFKTITKHAALGHCMLKGELQRELVNESRAGSTSNLTPSSLIVVDSDGIKGVETAADAIKLLPPEFHGVDYIAQYSSSMGIDPGKGLSVHLFFMADKPYMPNLLKAWFIHMNLTNPLLRQSISLTRTDVALRWPLDPSIALNSSLIYTAPPVLGKGVKDTFKGDRIQLVKGKKRTLTPNLDDVNSEKNRQVSRDLIDELRAAKGLAKRPKTTEKITKGVDVPVAVSPGQADLTGHRIDGDWVHMNLNHGDSWSYYHHIDNHEYIYTFKYDLAYRTADLLPEYYGQCEREKRQEAQPEGNIRIIAALDKKSNTYYRGTYDTNTDELDLYMAKTLTILHDYMALNGQVPPEHIEEWDFEFRFDDERAIDFDKRFANMYKPSVYFQDPKRTMKVPPTISKVINSAMGNDQEGVEHILNWLACIFQHRTKLGTAWLLHGTQGTGKGLLFNKILTPLVGMQHTARVQLSAFDKEHNGFMKQAVFVLVDEVEVSRISRQNNTMARVKALITDDPIDIREMRTDIYSARNYSHFLFYSNTHESVEIPPNDRRFNVAARQEERLEITAAEVDRIEDELADFAGYLMHRETDLVKARTPMENEERRHLQELSRNSNEAAADAILNGDLDFFWDNRPQSEGLDIAITTTGPITTPLYMDILYRLSQGQTHLSRDDMGILIYYTTGKSFETPNQLKKFLGHRGIKLKPVSLGGKTVLGLYRKEPWTRSEETAAEIKKTIKPGLKIAS